MSKNSGAPDRRYAGPQPKAGEHTTAVMRGSKLDLIRMIAADLIGRIEEADAISRASLLMELRSVQDLIVGIKHRQPALSARPSQLDWVDSWSPPL